MRSGATNKGARGARKLPLDGIRDALEDGRVWTKLGVVTLFPGETSHYELDGEDLLVDVELMPERKPCLCRMGAAIGGRSGHGVYFVPKVGTEVLVCVPDGDLENDPVIVACLSSGQIPSELTADNLVIVSSAGIVIHALDGPVTVVAEGGISLGGAPLNDPTKGLVNGECVDAFTGTPYAALHSLTGAVTTEK